MIHNAYAAAYAAIALQALRHIVGKVLASHETLPAGLVPSVGKYYLCLQFAETVGTNASLINVPAKEYGSRPDKPLLITRAAKQALSVAGYKPGWKPALNGDYTFCAVLFCPYWGKDNDYVLRQSVPGVARDDLARMVDIVRRSV